MPSFVPPSFRRWRWARPCASEIMLSLRVSVQRTGLPERRASQHDEQLFGAEVRLDAEAAADVRRDHAQVAELHAERAGKAELVLVRHLRREPGRERPSSPTSAAAERTSSGQPAMRGLTSVSETITSQPSKSVSSYSRRAGVDGDVRADVREEQHLVLQRLVADR